MPVKPRQPDWKAYLDGLIWQQQVDQVVQELEGMSGRDLYECKTYSMCPRYLIDRPVNFAMHGTYSNYELDSVKLMRDCLIDGEAFVKVEDWTHLTIEPYVYKTVYDPATEELQELWVSFLAEDELYYTTKYILKEPGKRSQSPATEYTYRPQRIIDEDRMEIDTILDIPYFPYVGFLWHNRASFLAPVHEALVRLETAYRVVAVENVERKGAQLYLEGVRNIDDIQSAPKRLGRGVHTLPEGARFHSPTPDGPGIDLMKWEIGQLWEGLEKATGVVSTEKLASLSGVSRQIAEKPLLMLCEDIRNVFEKGMQDIELASRKIGGPPLEISFQPLHEIEDTSNYLSQLNEAYDKGVVTDKEYIREFRRLLEMDSMSDSPNDKPLVLKAATIKPTPSKGTNPNDSLGPQ